MGIFSAANRAKIAAESRHIELAKLPVVTPDGIPTVMGGLGVPMRDLGFRRIHEHYPRGNPCAVCGAPAAKHRIRTRKQEREEVLKQKRERKKGRSSLRVKNVKQQMSEPFIGIDGEGHGRNPHLYTLLAAVDESGTSWHVENQEGLSTVECLDFILSLSDTQYIFAYSFNYDLTKILNDLPERELYLLFRPELRQRPQKHAKLGPKPVKWGEYILNLQGSKFELKKGTKGIVIWDIFKFFQAKFVTALKDWKVGTPELWERMSEMKEQRGSFTVELADAVRAYCKEECLCMAQLARKLVDAHTAAGLELKNFYGAGSSASAMLKKMGIKDKIVPPPDQMIIPVAQAFFGGRFENNVIGEIPGPVYNYDISSAYPYSLYFLPCLEHARWSHTKKIQKARDARHALIRYSLREKPRITNWAPFPFRDRKGNICYPYASDGGWVWRDEFFAGLAAFPENVVFHEAWILEEECDCHPFKDIAHYYRERCRIGKEGPGIVMKLGCNSCYGKIAQSVGNGIFNSWIWAGMITSGCRAQIIDMIAMHDDRADCLMIATDGIFTRQRLDPPKPRDTETWETGKPLGGWEEKIIDQPVFIARPGIYFPMNPTQKQLKDCKGRGVGKKIVYDNWELISDSWREHGVSKVVEVANVTRFCGAKTSVSSRTREGKREFHRADGTGEGGERPQYGEWVSRKVKMSFDPMPKRDGIAEDGVHLVLRGQTGESSVMYAKADLSEEAKQLKQATEEAFEQPDVDMEEIT